MFTFFTSTKLKANKGRISNYVQVSEIMLKYSPHDLVWKHWVRDWGSSRQMEINEESFWVKESNDHH